MRASATGGVALITALSIPPILLIALGAIELQAVVTDKQKTQDAADAAALWGAQQLTVTPTGVDERTKAFAVAQLDQVKANASVEVGAQVLGKNTIKVVVDTHRPSFFMNLLPLGGFNTHVESVAEGVAQSPLCVLIVGSGSGDDVQMKETSKLQGPACMVHSNHAVKADGSALIQAETVEAGTTASGPISPAASTGAPTIQDPFASLDVNFSCLGALLPMAYLFDSTMGASGNLLGDLVGDLFNYSVADGRTLTLAKGEHFLCGDLKLGKGSKLVGDDVVLIFSKDSKLDLKDGASVSLNGRKSGRFAGFVMITNRNRTNDFQIDSDPIANITGTIYVPNAKLIVNGSKRAGASSAWTVLTSESFEGKGGANLVINANYGGSDVPVPDGVGNRAAGTRLTK